MDGTEDGEESDYNDVFDKSQYEGKKGHLLLQLQKSFKGDERFQLQASKDFDVNLKEMSKQRKQLPSTLLGALSKREEDLLKQEDDTPKAL